MNYIIYNGELYHHGTKGMKWGQRLYQNKDGSLTVLGKARYGSVSNMKKKQKAKSVEKAKKTRQANTEAAKKAKQEQEEFEAGKKKAIESGSASDVLKYKGKMTNQELQQAVSRIHMEKTLSEISAKETKTGLDKAESFMDKVDRVTKMTNKGVDAYNTLAKILNSTTGSELPIISEKNKGSNKKKKNDDDNDNDSSDNKKPKEQDNSKEDDSSDNTGKTGKKGRIKRSADEFFKKKKNGERENVTVDPDDIIGEGTSRRKTNDNSKKRKTTDDIIWGTYVDKTPSSVSKHTTSLGESYISGLLDVPIAGLLEAPKDRDR